MKLTKTQYKKLEGLMPIARKPAKISNYKFMCVMFYIIEIGYKWMALPKKYGNRHTIYMKFSKWSKNGAIANVIAFFLSNHILEAMNKQKLLNGNNSIFLIDSTITKLNPDANENNHQEQSIRC